MATQWGVDDIPDLTGLVAVVTGANSGIGMETTAALARAGATVVMACRNGAKAEAARDELLARSPSARLELLRLDLADQGQVAEAGAELRERHPVIDRLVNNGGVMSIPQSTTVDGFETVFGTNHLGHFALTAHLLPALLAAPSARVVTVSSLSARMGRVGWDDLHQERSYSRAKAYSQSKLANLLFAFELDHRLRGAGATAMSLAVHPGTASSEIAHTLEERYPRSGRVIRGSMEWMVPTPASAARSSLRAATDPAVQGGQFYGPGRVGGLGGPPVLTRRWSRSADEAAMRRLWDLSVDLTGVEWPFP